MKKTIKLTDMRQNELQKDDMNSLVGGNKITCPLCNCNCGNCNNTTDGSNKMDSTHSSNNQIGWLSVGLNVPIK